MSLAKSQAFEMVRMKRSDLKGATYNPRKISEAARKKLASNLRKVGLVQPLIFNRRTGTLLGGHQRLACLDAIERRDDYELDVSVVDLSPKEEREQNVFLNNQSAMGEFDIDALAEMLGGDLDAKALGFDALDIEMLFEGTAHEEKFASLWAETDATVKADALDLAKAKEIFKATQESRKAKSEAQDPEFFAVVVFKDRADQSAFMELCGYARDDRYIDGPRLFGLLSDK